jgi:DNA modification methylase
VIDPEQSAERIRNIAADYGKAKGENMEKVAFHGKVDGASRFFMRFDPTDAPFIYTPKASKKDRNAGVERNNHPTVKSTALMRYLVKLVTPPGGWVLDPFMGSGSTGAAAFQEGFNFIGIEKEADYMAIAEARIAHAHTKGN